MIQSSCKMKPIWLDESLRWIGTILLPTSPDPICAFEGGMSVRLADGSIDNRNYSTAVQDDRDGRTLSVSLAF